MTKVVNGYTPSPRSFPSEKVTVKIGSSLKTSTFIKIKERPVNSRQFNLITSFEYRVKTKKNDVDVKLITLYKSIYLLIVNFRYL